VIDLKTFNCYVLEGEVFLEGSLMRSRRKSARVEDALYSATTEPKEPKKVRWPNNRLVLNGTKVKGSVQAFLVARGQYPVRCQQIGRRIHTPIMCANENVLASALMGFDWKTDYAIIRKAHDGPVIPQPPESHYLPTDEHGVILADEPWKAKKYAQLRPRAA